MAQTPGQYALVVDRVEIAKTRMDELQALMEELGIVFHVEIVTSEEAKTKGRVATRISDAGAQLGVNPHVVLIITHAGMTRVRDWSDFHGWDAIIIDEVPPICERSEHRVSRWDGAALEAFYSLRPTKVAGVSRITAKRGLSASDVPELWRPFHDRVMTGEARCNLTTWAEIANLEEPWSSWRIWDVRVLEGKFREVIFLADAFPETEAAAIMALDPGLTFIPFSIGQTRHWRQRNVEIRYVSAHRLASTTRFKSEKPADVADMAKVAAWVGAVDDPNHLWTTNTGVDLGDLPTAREKPKQAGSNKFKLWTKASIIYAAKSSPSERKFFAGLGIDADTITASREHYDICQFLLRTSLRNPDSTATVELRVFDRVQAETFADKLLTAYGLHASLIHDDIGLTDTPEDRGGRPRLDGTRPPPMTREERKKSNAEAQRRRRDKLKQTKEAA